ncbi:MAG: PAS domain S-box protein [Candidatus Protistobacter heckmanni]|nr:PAS domain S-box protein [Candidatus Protistobacter heckmanni]
MPTSGYEGERRFLSRDGTYHTMRYAGSPVFDRQGKVIYWVGVDAEVSELKNTEEALRLSNRELEAFSYSVSHDLRSPLAVIDGFSRAVLQKYGDKMDPESRSYLDRVRARTIEMAQLIEDLLSLARVIED